MSAHIDPCDAETNGGDCSCAEQWKELVGEWVELFRHTANLVSLPMVVRAKARDLLERSATRQSSTGEEG